MSKKDVAKIKKSSTFATSNKARSVSSVGLERLLDRQEVTGSNPVQITKAKGTSEGVPFLFSTLRLVTANSHKGCHISTNARMMLMFNWASKKEERRAFLFWFNNWGAP